jgi:hypothetical protein
MAGPPLYPGTPRWVKVFGIVAVALVLLGVISFLTGHGPPGRHLPSGNLGGDTPPSRITEGRTPAAGGH